MNKTLPIRELICQEIGLPFPPWLEASNEGNGGMVVVELLTEEASYFFDEKCKKNITDIAANHNREIQEVVNSKQKLVEAVKILLGELQNGQNVPSLWILDILRGLINVSHSDDLAASKEKS